MTFRFMGLIPAMALLAAGTVQAQPANNATTGGGGSMAYPDSLPSGQVRIPAPTSRDTGNMAYPASPGGVSQAAPTGPDTNGSMGAPQPSGGVTTTPAPTPRLTRRGRAAARAAASATQTATPAAGGVAPTADGMAAARALDAAPGAAAVPYVDFSQPAAPKGVMRARRAVVRRAAPAKKAPATATPAATAPAATAPAASAPATPAAPAPAAAPKK